VQLLFDHHCAVATAKKSRRRHPTPRTPVRPPACPCYTRAQVSRLQNHRLDGCATKNLKSTECKRLTHTGPPTPSFSTQSRTRWTLVPAQVAQFTKVNLRRPRVANGKRRGRRPASRPSQPTNPAACVLLGFYTKQQCDPVPPHPTWTRDGKNIVRRFLLVLRVALVDLRTQICERAGILHPLVSWGVVADTGGVRVWEGGRFRRDKTRQDKTGWNKAKATERGEGTTPASACQQLNQSQALTETSKEKLIIPGSCHVHTGAAGEMSRSELEIHAARRNPGKLGVSSLPRQPIFPVTWLARQTPKLLEEKRRQGGVSTPHTAPPDCCSQSSTPADSHHYIPRPVPFLTFGCPTPTSFVMFPLIPAWHSANKNAWGGDR